VSGSRAARWIGAIGCALAAAAVAGCGEDEPVSKAVPLSVTVTEPSKGRLAYSARRTVPAGLVELTLENKGRERRKGQLFRIDGKHSVAEALRVRGPLPRWLRWEGGVGMTAPGAKASVTQRLHPGRYYITGNRGDNARVAPLTVVDKDSGGKLPDATGSIVSNEYSFTASGLEAGPNSLEFSNEGLEPHHAVVAPVKRGASVAQLRRFLRGRGPIPVGDIVNLRGALETSVIEGGQSQVMQLKLGRGKYALLCFVADRKGGPSHVVKGMVDEVTVR
jgi:hypothetical protein